MNSPLGAAANPVADRRRFLTLASSLALFSTASTSRATTIDPFERPVPGKLKLSLAAYSMRQYLSDKTGPDAMDLFQFVDYCADQGLAGAELTSYYFPDEPTTSYLLALKRHCHLRGISISGGAIRNDFCQLDRATVEASLEHTRKWIDIYALLGAPAIRIFAGNEQAGEPLTETLSRCAAICEEACGYAEQKGILLALENHGGVTAKAEGLLEVVKQVDSTAFGVNFDSGNFRSTDDPYAELAAIAPYAVNAQLKVDMQVSGKSVPTDLRRVLEILSTGGYSGWVALEYEAAEDPKVAIPKYLQELSVLIADFQ